MKLKKIHSLLIAPIRLFFYKTNNIWIFRKLGILIYKTGLFATIQIFKKMPEIESIYSKTNIDKNFILGVSDIDLTVIAKDMPLKKEIEFIKDYNKKWIYIVSIFPFLRHIELFFNKEFESYQKSRYSEISPKGKHFINWKLIYGEKN